MWRNTDSQSGKHKATANRTEGRKLPLRGVALFLLAAWGATALPAQERFVMSQEDSNKFRLARQHYQKGGQMMAKNNQKDAKKEFTACVETFPDYAHAWYALAQIAYGEGDLAMSADYIGKAKQTFPKLAILDNNTEMQYLEMLRAERSRAQDKLFDTKDMLSRLSMNTKLTEVERNRLQTQYQNQIMQLENSLRELDQRLSKPIPEANEIPADFYYVHGNIFFKMKKYMDSMQQYLEAVRVDPTHGEAYNNLANLHYMARKYEKALYYLDKAISNGFQSDPRFREALLKAMAAQQ